jgi:antitoxin component of RelBE/YafQ-DinJ toxin-antitoxin module
MAVVARKMIQTRLDEALVTAFDASAERRGLTRTAAIEKLMRRQVEVDARTDEYPMDFAKRPPERFVADQKPSTCRHPIGQRIGDSCAACGAKVSKAK